MSGNGNDLTIADYPELELLCWNRAVPTISRSDAHGLYRAYWHMVSVYHMRESERQFLAELVTEFGPI